MEIIPLLPELDVGELQELRAYEAANRNRIAITSRIDALAGSDTRPRRRCGCPRGRGCRLRPGNPGRRGPGDLPIADYDFLGVSEILPLLAELDEDELDMVRRYEAAGRGRATVLYRIDALMAAPRSPRHPEPEPATAPTAPEPVAEAPAAAPTGARTSAGGRAQAIADYDKLRVFQILVACSTPTNSATARTARRAVHDPQPDRRPAGRRSRIHHSQRDRQPRRPRRSLRLPPRPSSPRQPPPRRPAPAHGAPEPEPEPEPAAAPAAAGDAGELPIADYDDLRQMEILGLLDELYDDELELVRDYEDATRARAAILFRIDALLGVEGALEEGAEEAMEEARRASGGRRAGAGGDRSGAGAGGRSRQAADEVAWGEWPIADYDDLTQLEIIPLLDELYDDELQQIRDYEDANRARAAVLFRIDALLSGEEAPDEDEEAGGGDERRSRRRGTVAGAPRSSTTSRASPIVAGARRRPTYRSPITTC